MQFAKDTKRVAAAILVAGLLAAALVVACPLEIHSPASRSVDTACIAMPHSTALGLASASLQLLSGAVVPMAGIALLRAPARRLRTLALLSPPADPLNERLRI